LQTRKWTNLPCSYRKIEFYNGCIIWQSFDTRRSPERFHCRYSNQKIITLGEQYNELNGACMRWWRALRRTMESFGWPSSVYCPQGFLNPRPQAVLFHRLIPSIFHKTFSKYTPKNSFKKRFFYMSRAKYVHFLVCILPN
jgi:hypothetical protein